MIGRIREAYQYRSFLFQLVYQQLDQRYHGSALGFLWTLLFPLLIFVSFTVIFSVLNNWEMKDYGVYFLSGYLFWLLFSNVCSMGSESIVGNSVYVTRVYVPKLLIPLSSVALGLVDLGAGLVILLALMGVIGAPFTAAMLFLPAAILIATVFVAGLSLLCAVANVLFRDFRHLLNSALFLLFFFCPILWKSEGAPPKASLFLAVNPLVAFLRLFQAPVWKGQLPDMMTVGLAGAFAVTALAAGIVVFLRTERRFYYYL